MQTLVNAESMGVSALIGCRATNRLTRAAKRSGVNPSHDGIGLNISPLTVPRSFVGLLKQQQIVHRRVG